MNNILCCATFPRDQFEREKHVIMEEIRKNRDVPYNRCVDEIDRILFHGTPYEHTITGNIGDIHNITYEAVCQYKAKHYTPDRMTVSIISNLPTPQLDRILGRLSMFTTKMQMKHTPVHIPENISIRPIDCAPILYRKLQTVHTHIMVGIFIPYPLKAREFVCYRIMSRIIAGNSSSRMFRRLRAQHGISYSSRCDLTYYPHIAKMDIYTSVEPAQYEKAFKLMMGCIRDPITKDEFELARGYCKGTMYIHDDESVESRVEYEMDEMLFPAKSRLGVEWSDLLKIYGAITYKDFCDIVKQFYKNRVQIVVLGHQQLKSNPQKL
jgi:predicted Zn-dependent peptidase